MSTTLRSAVARPVAERDTAAGRFAQLERVASVARVLAVSLGILLLSSAAGLALYAYLHLDRVYEGVTVGGVQVGGMTEAEARAVIEERFATYVDDPIRLSSPTGAFELEPTEIGLAIDGVASADGAMAFGRSGSLTERMRDWMGAALRGRDVPAVVTYDRGRLDAELASLAPSVTRPPVDAYVRMEGAAGPEIVPEQPGVAFDMGTTRALLDARFAALSHEPVSLVLAAVDPAVAAADLVDNLPAAKAAVAEPLVLSGLDRSWIVSSADLTRIVSVQSTNGAVKVDREALRDLLRGIAREIERPSRDAGIRVTDDLQFALVAAEAAVEVDVAGSVEAVVDALRAGSHEVELGLTQEPPRITDDMASLAVRDAEALVDRAVRLRWSDGEARLGRVDLVSALVIEPRPGERDPFRFDVDRERLAEILQTVAEEIDVTPRDAEFRLVKGKVTVATEAAAGRQLDTPGAAEAVAEAVLSGGNEVELPILSLDPTYTASERKKIKVPDLLGDSWTYYGNSSEPRRYNVERAVGLEDGWLVPPDGVFSYNQYLGEVSEEGGFVTGFGIVAAEGGGVTTAPVVGGGICQVSTTIFQAAFWAGLPIVERYPHPYWIQSYGEPPRGMKGLDAMVNIEEDWSLDMKFRNTTGNWIAVVVKADGQNVTAQILGTDPGWTIEVGEVTVSNVVPPDRTTIYTESPELPAGQELQVESAQEGFDTQIPRIVKKDGKVIDQMVLISSYTASRNTILRGTGTGE